MRKEILTGIEAIDKMQSGVNKLADIVKSTLGAKGRNVMFTNDAFGIAPTVTNDGVTIAKEIDFKDNFENMVAQLVKEVALKTNELAGDGTTTSIVLAQSLINGGFEKIKDGANPIEIKRGIEKAVELVVKRIKEMAVPINGRDDIEKIATISGNNDPEIGKVIADIFDEIGKDGTISVEESNGIGLSKEIVEGMTFNKGLMSSFLTTDDKSRRCELKDPYVIVVDEKINGAIELSPILKRMYEEKKNNLLVIANDFGQEALNLIVANKLKGLINFAAVMSPGFGDDRIEILQDIATLTGATLISSKVGISINDFNSSMAGRAKKVVSDKNSTTIIGGSGSEENIESRVKSIKDQIKDCSDNNKKILLTDRLAKLTGGIGIIRVGGFTTTEMREKRFRVEDAVEATKAAIEEGVVAGGGIALFRINLSEFNIGCNSVDESFGVDIVVDALTSPLSNIISNAGKDSLAIPNKISQAVNINYGYNVKTDEFGDMIEMGIIDPAKVTRCALENAASVAAQILTTNSMIVYEKTEENY